MPASVLLALALPACERASLPGPAPNARAAEPVATPKETPADAGLRAADDAPPPAPAGRAAPRPVAGCVAREDVLLFTSPRAPAVGQPVRVVAVSEAPLAGTLRLRRAGGDVLATSDVVHGGPPWFVVLETMVEAKASLVAELVQPACAPDTALATAKVDVSARGRLALPNAKEGVWPVRAAWNRKLENLYSAWVELLFDAPEAEMPSWSALHEVLRDPARNVLHDHLGAGEDVPPAAPLVRPDCADLPYTLRAYFAWKLGLPFGVGSCNRGGGGRPPSCKGLLTVEEPPARPGKDGVATFGAFVRGTLADRAHSGSARAPFDEPESDYYGVPVTWESLRPGTVYADPYGHVLVVAKRLPQTEARGGVLFAVDGQPDGTVAKKRFWRGNFLYATEPELGGPGWKRFRPLVRRGGALVRQDDAAIAKSAEYGDAKREGFADVDAFYDRMEDVLSPEPLDPTRAMLETVAALEEQVRTRVKSVDNGRLWLAKGQAPAAMPEGPEIFETTGAWEDFSTPSRDLRLLIAIDVARGFPSRVERRPARFAMPSGKAPAQVRSDLEARLARELASRSVSYARTDGSSFTLSLAEVVARAAALEVAYDPNDCAETRWGAPKGSDEASTCHAQAPAEQRARLERYRVWFRDRKRPPRK